MFSYRLYKYTISTNNAIYVLLDRKNKIVRFQLMDYPTRRVLPQNRITAQTLLRAYADIMARIFIGEPASAVFVAKNPSDVPMPYFRRQA